MSESQPKGELGSEENRTWTGNSTGSTLPSSLLGRDPIILITVLLGLTLRAYFAGQKGLVLDEFHSDFHASRATFSELLQSVRADNHPPLSFALISLAQDLFGKSDFALRIPALIAAALEFTFVGLLARPYGKTFFRKPLLEERCAAYRKTIFRILPYIYIYILWLRPCRRPLLSG